jgi:ribose transport system permease protein
MRQTDLVTPANPTKGLLLSRQSRLALAAASVVVAIVAALVLGGFINPAFLTFENLLLVVRAASLTGMVALGMSVVTISGNMFALSGEQMATLSAVVFAILMSQNFGFAVSVALTLGFGAVLGLAQAAVVVAGANPIIATLAFGALFRGLATLFSSNGYVAFKSAAASWLGTARPLGIPTQSWAFVILSVAAAMLIRKARLGRVIVLVGANPLAALSSGLRTSSATLISLTAFALTCSFIGIFTASQFSLAKPTLFDGMNIDIIAAVLVGGVSLKGGRGSPFQAALGAIFIALAQNLMLLNNVTTGVRMLVVGGLVVVAIAGFQLFYGRGR